MVRFARCNALLSLALDSSGKGCRYVAKGASDDDVVKEMRSEEGRGGKGCRSRGSRLE